MVTVYVQTHTHTHTCLQIHRAFTCGLEELMVTADGDKTRRGHLIAANNRTLDAAAKFAEINYEDK
jgi:hypothetical protein